MRDYVEFFRQFRERFQTTGAVTPSSRFLAGALTGPLRKRDRPARILEVGPGTGAVTRRIVRALGPEDRLDLVEINRRFAAMLRHRFRTEPSFRDKADRVRIHCCPLEEFQAEAPYDFIVSGLPLNNFEPELVRTIFDSFFRLLAPDGTLSYFEYMCVRPIRRRISNGTERSRIAELDSLLGDYLARHRFRRSWVFANFPPAWVQHLRQADHAPADDVDRH
ncbi:MAG: methyltransferase domain-containing protein [Planctomycetales bacterium]